MQSMPTLSDRELLARMPTLVRAERMASAEVIAHLMEIERRRLYLGEACSSLFAYCRERLGYSEDAALKRMRVARLALVVPAALDELRSGRIHLTGLFVLSRYVTPENADELLGEARGKSRSELEHLLARRFPRPDVAERIAPIAGLGAGGVVVTGPVASGVEFRGRTEPLSASRYRVEFTASSEFCEKLERAREVLIAGELRRRGGAGKPRKRRELQLGSRHVPVEVARVVWERDGFRCAFVDAEGRRCSERRFLTLEHRIPFAFGGLPTPENLCLHCAPHNAYTAREAFGQALLERTRAQRKRAEAKAKAEATTGTRPGRAADVKERALSALVRLGFGRAQVVHVLSALDAECAESGGQDVTELVRAALVQLTPQLSCA